MRTLTILLFMLLLSPVLRATDTDSLKISNKKWITLSAGVESNLLQFASVSYQGVSWKTIPRYTYFFNMGVDADLKLGNHFKIFSGLNLKNIGLIHKINDSIKEKHRVYMLGAPLGFKIAMAHHKVIFKAGADLSIAFNYKWKRFINNSKTKNNEFFSNKTESLFYSVFAGLSVHGVSVTCNYYLNNFFKNPSPAVSEIKSNLLVIGMGLNIDSRSKKPMNNKGHKNFNISI